MTSLSLVNPSAFGKTLLEQYLEQGFQSLGKRDLDPLSFFSSNATVFFPARLPTSTWPDCFG